jgi:hypothetical protein
VERLAIVASLKPGTEERARTLLAAGPPFDPADAGLTRHVVYLSAGEVVFVFEGSEVEWRVDDLVDSPFQWQVSSALEEWREIIAGPPRIARPTFEWSSGNPAPAPDRQS